MCSCSFIIFHSVNGRAAIISTFSQVLLVEVQGQESGCCYIHGVVHCYINLTQALVICVIYWISQSSKVLPPVPILHQAVWIYGTVFFFLSFNLKFCKILWRWNTFNLCRSHAQCDNNKKKTIKRNPGLVLHQAVRNQREPAEKRTPGAAFILVKSDYDNCFLFKILQIISKHISQRYVKL